MNIPTLRYARRPRAIASALAVAAGLSFLTACNSTPDKPPITTPSPSPSPTPLTKEEYVSQVLLMCAAYKEPTNEPRPTTAAEFVAAVKRDIQKQKDFVAKLRTLAPPTADRQQLEDNFLSKREKGIALLENAQSRMEGTAATGDLKGAQDSIFPVYEEAAKLDQEAAPFLISYGLGECI
jgi:hypothetical protein